DRGRFRPGYSFGCCARLVECERRRGDGQGQFSPELAAQGIRHHRLSKLTEKIAEEPQEDWRTDTLAAEAGVSPRSLSRLFLTQLDFDVLTSFRDPCIVGLWLAIMRCRHDILPHSYLSPTINRGWHVKNRWGVRPASWISGLG